MSKSYPSALPPATKLFLDALQAGGKLNSPTGPTVLAQAGAQMGVTPQMEPPPEEQQGIAAILNQAQQAGPIIANNQAAAQQQQLVDQAANQAAPAAAQMLQEQQNPQGLAQSGLAALPSHIQEFKEGGVIGYAEGKFVDGATFADLSSASPEMNSGIASSSFADLSANRPEIAPGPPPEVATSEFGDFFRMLGAGLKKKVDRDDERHRLVMQRRALDSSPFKSFTPTERAARLAQVKEIDAKINAIYGNEPDSAEAAAQAMTAPVVPAAKTAPKKAAPAATAKPAPKTDASAGSSKVSVSTREKIGGPTEPEKSGIDAIPVPTAQPIDMTEANALYNQSKQLRANKPDFEARGLADIAAMQQRDKDSSAFRRYATIAGARRPGINAGASMMAAAGQFAQTEDALANTADAAKTALAKAKYAESVGDVDALLKYQEEFNKHKESYSTLKAHLDATVYNAKMGASSREEIAAMRADSAQQMMALRLQTSSIGKNLKNPVDVMNIVEDNLEKYMKNWDSARAGTMAKAPEREAEYTKRKLQMIAEMRAMGAVLPEGFEKLLGGAQTTKTIKLNPETHT